MAGMSMPTIEELQRLSESDDVLSISDPTCGAGCLLLALPAEIAKLPDTINKAKLQRNIFIVGQDIDALCVKMSYVQLSLCGYPGVVIHGDSLTLKTWKTWHTPTFFVFDTFQRWCRKNAEKEERQIQDQLISILNDSSLFFNMQNNIFSGART